MKPQFCSTAAPMLRLRNRVLMARRGTASRPLPRPPAGPDAERRPLNRRACRLRLSPPSSRPRLHCRRSPGRANAAPPTWCGSKRWCCRTRAGSRSRRRRRSAAPWPKRSRRGCARRRRHARRARAPLKAIDNYASYDCRGRNRVVGAKLSEHGKANALDIRSLKLADGKVVELTDPHVARDFREGLRQSACARFTTVLGPGLRRLSRGPRPRGPRRAPRRLPHVPMGRARAGRAARPLPRAAAAPPPAPQALTARVRRPLEPEACSDRR